MFLSRSSNVAAVLTLLSILVCLANSQDTSEEVKLLKEQVDRLEQLIQNVPKSLTDLTRHVMLLEHQARERIMGEGNSGIVKVRDYTVGPSNFHYSSHTGQSFANMHDHSNHEKVYGLGDFMMVMNGVHFRTRHNDFELRRPSTTSGDWLATEEIELPPLPAGLEAMSVEEQIFEIREYIRAFNFQDESIRPYKDFFKPVLCYLEGWWDKNTTTIENGFTSLRLAFGARSWQDMQDKARADEFLGSDFSIYQNDASLPVTILGVDETTGEVVYGQWNYRVICHPLDEDVPTSLFKPIEDYAYRLQNNVTMEDFYMYKGARYVLDSSSTEHAAGRSILDTYVAKIPGLDNIPSGSLNEDLVNRPKTANLKFYNRAYTSGKDGLKSTEQLRGFSDGNVFMSMTSQSQVAPLKVKQCVSKRTCLDSEIRASWMVPLEILYMSPLQRWNPYGLAHSDNPDFAGWSGGADGNKESNAYPGTHLRAFYRTPEKTFDRQKGRDKMPADSYTGVKWVAAPDGVARRMLASGPRTLLPQFDDVPETRLRYPILRLHEEGTGVWKALNGFIQTLNGEFSELDEQVLEYDYY